MKSKLMICPKAGECRIKKSECISSVPHKKEDHCNGEGEKGWCGHVGEFIKCIPYRPKQKEKVVRVKGWAYYADGETDSNGFHAIPEQFEGTVPCRIELKKSDYDKLRRKK